MFSLQTHAGRKMTTKVDLSHLKEIQKEQKFPITKILCLFYFGDILT